jgi:hypothetical protein
LRIAVHFAKSENAPSPVGTWYAPDGRRISILHPLDEQHFPDSQNNCLGAGSVPVSEPRDHPVCRPHTLRKGMYCSGEARAVWPICAIHPRTKHLVHTQPCIHLPNTIIWPLPSPSRETSPGKHIPAHTAWHPFPRRALTGGRSGGITPRFRVIAPPLSAC